jgi:DNA polymerase III alpha subunit
MKGKNLGKQMFFVEVSDGSQNVNCTVFPDQFEEYGSLITKGNRVLLFGKRDAKYNSSLTVQKAVQA